MDKLLNKHLYVCIRDVRDMCISDSVSLNSTKGRVYKMMDLILNNTVRLYDVDTNELIKIPTNVFYESFLQFDETKDLLEEENMEEKTKVNRHKELCDNIHELYKQKNEKYGDSFGISVRKYGLIAALTRMSDKFNRLEQLILTKSNGTSDESLIDTLTDLSNYALMTVMELEDLNK